MDFRIRTLAGLPGVGSAQVASDVVQAPIEEVVVVGTRALPRSIEDSSVPVDVIGNEDFEDQVGFDMSNLIRSTVPSFHVSDNPSRDLAALRGRIFRRSRPLLYSAWKCCATVRRPSTDPTPSRAC